FLLEGFLEDLGRVQPGWQMKALPEVVFLAGLVGTENQEVEGQRQGKGPGQARSFGPFQAQRPSWRSGNRHALSVCRRVAAAATVCTPQGRPLFVCPRPELIRRPEGWSWARAVSRGPASPRIEPSRVDRSVTLRAAEWSAAPLPNTANPRRFGRGQGRQRAGRRVLRPSTPGRALRRRLSLRSCPAPGLLPRGHRCPRRRGGEAGLGRSPDRVSGRGTARRSTGLQSSGRPAGPETRAREPGQSVWRGLRPPRGARKVPGRGNTPAVS